ncbi:MAG: hypothetical protein HGA24_07520 [Candidatus Aminicenantes bacterium]|nr:hypothetical protein [Candidatus Aminicenantes bacterium]
MRLPYRETIDKLPPPWKENLLPAIREAFARAGSTLIVMDDDPTGCQTVHGIPILTAWPVEALSAEFERSPVFFILTNSRSLPAREAIEINREVARNIVNAASSAGRRFMVISRSDSTLRGHFRAEIETLKAEFAWQKAVTLCIPAFFEGGRFTIDDVHYVKEGDELVPAGETPYAKDPSFGFSSSNLKDYIREKMGGAIAREDVCSVTLEDIRRGGPGAVAEKLEGCDDGSFCVVNACERSDMDVVALAVFRAMERGKRFLFRTAAAIIPALIGLTERSLLAAREFPPTQSGCGLIVVGSFVPMSSRQLEHLLKHGGVRGVELDVRRLLSGEGKIEIERAMDEANRFVGARCDTVIYTSRELVTGATAEESIRIQADVAAALIGIVRGIQAAPRYVLAKGGITSHDIAAKALGVQRAVVMGQIIPGVPVWRLGEGSRFPGMSYIVFPGNVGTETSMTDVVRALRTGA